MDLFKTLSVALSKEADDFDLKSIEKVQESLDEEIEIPARYTEEETKYIKMVSEFLQEMVTIDVTDFAIY